MNTEIPLRSVAIIGFGEAGSILGEDLAKIGLEVATHDILLDAPGSRAAMLSKAHAAHVRAADTLADALNGVPLVISAVTASSSGDVARDAARALHAGQYFLDINSVAPATKRANATAVEASGADYVEAAVMAAIPPQRLAVPILLGGPKAAELEPILRSLGMNVTSVGHQIGVASSIKMCRSILIKGLEALTVECLTAARTLGAEREVLASLAQTFPGMGWTEQLPDYLVSRVAEHGHRRAAEMREVARTLVEIGMEPLMASAAAERQQRLVDHMAAKGVSYHGDEPFSWRTLIDALAEQETLKRQ